MQTTQTAPNPAPAVLHVRATSPDAHDRMFLFPAPRVSTQLGIGTLVYVTDDQWFGVQLDGEQRIDEYPADTVIFISSADSLSIVTQRFGARPKSGLLCTTMADAYTTDEIMRGLGFVEFQFVELHLFNCDTGELLRWATTDDCEELLPHGGEGFVLIDPFQPYQYTDTRHFLGRIVEDDEGNCFSVAYGHTSDERFAIVEGFTLAFTVFQET